MGVAKAVPIFKPQATRAGYSVDLQVVSLAIDKLAGMTYGTTGDLA